MRRKHLYKISIFLSVIGLTLMYASSLYINLDNTDIGRIDRSLTGETLEVTGEARNVTESSGHLFMDLEDDTGSILVVDFDTRNSVSEGDRLNVTGHVSLYEGELEIIADEIETG